MKPYEPYEAASRALYEIGHMHRYHLLFNNCEEFAKWCPNGVNVSGQSFLVEFGMLLTTAAIFVAIKSPQFQSNDIHLACWLSHSRMLYAVIFLVVMQYVLCLHRNVHDVCQFGDQHFESFRGYLFICLIIVKFMFLHHYSLYCL